MDMGNPEVARDGGFFRDYQAFHEHRAAEVFRVAERMPIAVDGPVEFADTGRS